METGLQIVFSGQESAGVQVLRMLLGTSHNIVGVFTSGNASAIGGAGVHKLAEQETLEIHPANYVRDERAVEALAPEHVDLVLNVHSLYIMHDSLLKYPQIGAFNLHPGPLPRLAGLNSISWAIFLGASEHGVTLHHMTPGIDEGAIAYQSIFDINGSDTPVSIMSRCAKEGAILIERLLADAEADPASIPRIEQDLSQRNYYGREVPNDGWIDWTWPAERVENFIRACDYHPFPSPWGRPMAHIGGREVTVGKGVRTGDPCNAAPGTVDGSESGSLRVACGDEWVLISRIRADEGGVETAEIRTWSDHFDLGVEAT